MARFFDWFHLAALACFLCLGIMRAWLLSARGVCIVGIDWQRTVAQGFADLLAVIAFLLWIYESAAYAWPLRSHVTPPGLAIVVIDAVPIKIAGAVVELLGLLIWALGLLALGRSWRIGIDRTTPGSLVTDGIFRWTRNPIYVGFDLLFVGTFLLLGRLVFLVLALVLIGMFHFVMLREERFLAQEYGDAYREYCSRVGRYVSWPSTRQHLWIVLHRRGRRGRGAEVQIEILEELDVAPTVPLTGSRNHDRT